MSLSVQNQIDSMKKDIALLMARSVHNKMSQDTRININQAVIYGPSFLKLNGGSNEIKYSGLQVKVGNQLYVVPVLQPDINSAYPGIITGSGVPTTAGIGGATITAPKGTIYINTVATTTTTRLWIATDSAGTWTYLTKNA